MMAKDSNYRNASNKRLGPYLIVNTLGGRLFVGGAYIIASIIDVLQKCIMYEFCYKLPFTSTFYAHITTQ